MKKCPGESDRGQGKWRNYLTQNEKGEMVKLRNAQKVGVQKALKKQVGP